MTFLDTIALAAGNLMRRKLRTLLTVLGVIIGTACIVIMVALGIGNLEQFNESIMQNENLTQIEIYPRGSDKQSQLTDAKLNSIRSIPGVKTAGGVMEIPSYIKMGRYVYDSSILAVDPETMDFKLMEGNIFADNANIEFVIGANARQDFRDPNAAYDYMGGGGTVTYIGGGMAVAEAVADGDAQKQQGPDVDWVGTQVEYYPAYMWEIEEGESTPENPKPKQYRAQITGVLEAADSQESYRVYMSIPAANKLIRENRKWMDNMGVKEGVYSNGFVNCTDVDAVADVLQAIKDMGYEAYSPTEWITQMQEEQGRQQSQLIAIGLISLLVSAIGIANTMLASILERSREIGVMKVIGLSISKINLMFLMEAAMIGLLGGLIGLGISYIFMAVSKFGGGELTFLGMYFMNGVQLSIPWWLAMGALAIAVGVGIVSGIYPAWKATKMSPLEAIRSSN